jgi:hypothetical protein
MFLAGLAIGLWVAVLVLFLIPKRDEPRYVVVPGASAPAYVTARTLWVPSGDGLYRCTNNDHGGGVVEDHGRGVVEDHGRGTVEDHGRGTVEDHGGGNVEDGAAHVPAPLQGRGYQQFWCDLNKHGGPVVRERDGRVVAVGMPVNGKYHCMRDSSGNALVVDEDKVPIDIDHGGGTVEDHGRGTVEDFGDDHKTVDNFDPFSLLQANENPDELTGSDRVYCLVEKPDSDPVVVDVNGEVVVLTP